MNPPPPGAVGAAVELLVTTRMVPAVTLLPAVPEAELPAAAAVLNERTEAPTVHTSVLVDGVTLASTHVVVTPV
jgi:hypothetical protein